MHATQYTTSGSNLSLLIQHKYDAIIVPGGAKGADTLSKSTQVQALVKEYHAKGKIVGMICAGKPHSKAQFKAI